MKPYSLLPVSSLIEHIIGQNVENKIEWNIFKKYFLKLKRKKCNEEKIT